MEAGDGEGERLQGAEAHGDGSVEEEVVVVGGIVEGLRGGQFGAISYGVSEEPASQRSPGQRGQLAQIDDRAWNTCQPLTSVFFSLNRTLFTHRDFAATTNCTNTE